MDELDVLDGVGQADLVRCGEVTSLELVEAAIARIEAAAVLNAVITRTFELARAAASAALPDGPLTVFRSS